MTSQKITTVARSPITEEIFKQFIQQLRTDARFTQDACDRVEAAMAAGKAINARNLASALFGKPGEGNS